MGGGNGQSNNSNNHNSNNNNNNNSCSPVILVSKFDEEVRNNKFVLYFSNPFFVTFFSGLIYGPAHSSLHTLLLCSPRATVFRNPRTSPTLFFYLPTHTWLRRGETARILSNIVCLTRHLSSPPLSSPRFIFFQKETSPSKSWLLLTVNHYLSRSPTYWPLLFIFFVQLVTPDVLFILFGTWTPSFFGKTFFLIFHLASWIFSQWALLTISAQQISLA